MDSLLRRSEAATRSHLGHFPQSGQRQKALRTDWMPDCSLQSSEDWSAHLEWGCSATCLLPSGCANQPYIKTRNTPVVLGCWHVFFCILYIPLQEGLCVGVPCSIHCGPALTSDDKRLSGRGAPVDQRPFSVEKGGDDCFLLSSREVDVPQCCWIRLVLLHSCNMWRIL